jgi:hypothetical protein
LNSFEFRASARDGARPRPQELIREHGDVTPRAEQILAQSLAVSRFADAAQKPSAQHQIVRCRERNPVRLDQARPRRVIAGLVESHKASSTYGATKNIQGHGQLASASRMFCVDVLYDFAALCCGILP